MMLRKNFIWILVAASAVITVVSLLFGVFFLFFFLPIMFPFALRRSKAKKEEDYRQPTPEQKPLRYDEDEEWREK